MDCPTGKKGFASKRMARYVARSHGHPEWRVYGCHVCGEYHLTHKRPNRRRWRRDDDRA